MGASPSMLMSATFRADQQAAIRQMLHGFVEMLVQNALTTKGASSRASLEVCDVLPPSAKVAKRGCVQINVQALDTHLALYVSRQARGYYVIGLRKRAIVREAASRTSWRARRDQLTHSNTRGHPFYLHRLMLTAGPSQLVRHVCSNKWCLNHAHLKLGTPKTNRDDRSRDASFERTLRSGKVCAFLNSPCRSHHS